MTRAVYDRNMFFSKHTGLTERTVVNVSAGRACVCPSLHKKSSVGSCHATLLASYLMKDRAFILKLQSSVIGKWFCWSDENIETKILCEYLTFRSTRERLRDIITQHYVTLGEATMRQTAGLTQTPPQVSAKRP